MPPGINAIFPHMSPTIQTEIIGLSVPERIQLVEDIWDSITEVPSAIPLTDAQKALLDRRLAFYQQNPDEGVPWDVVREEIRSYGW